jgi:hypothetical protein
MRSSSLTLMIPIIRSEAGTGCAMAFVIWGGAQ